MSEDGMKVSDLQTRKKDLIDFLKWKYKDHPFRDLSNEESDSIISQIESIPWTLENSTEIERLCRLVGSSADFYCSQCGEFSDRLLNPGWTPDDNYEVLHDICERCLLEGLETIRNGVPE